MEHKQLFIFLISYIGLIIYLLTNYNKNSQEKFIVSEENKPIYDPIQYNYGYSDSRDHFFSAHPNKLVQVKEIDANRYTRISESGGEMYSSFFYNKEKCKKENVECSTKYDNHLMDKNTYCYKCV
jgi:hypothetical protein